MAAPAILRAAAIVFVVLAAAVLPGCSGEVDTAGNATIRLIIDLQMEEYPQAYARLCDGTKDSVSLTAFTRSRGGQFRAPLAAETAMGADEQYPDQDTIDGDMKTAWTEVEGLVDGTMHTWRFLLARQHGRWRVCAIGPGSGPSSLGGGP